MGQLNNMIQWTGNNLKEVIDFTGKSPRFGEWFKSWEEYENYVHTHNDILKLFCEDGSHYEVPVGAWIVKTPDGYNVPSVARFIPAKQEQPDNWDKQYQEDNLQTRFAFYTYKDEDNALYLSNVFVEKTRRCKGLGTKILQAAEKVAETIGAPSIRLKVEQNSIANNWYRKHGYGYLASEDKYDWLEKNLEYLKFEQKQSEEEIRRRRL